MAAPVFKMQIQGAAELEQALRDLPKALGESALRRALTQAGQPVVEDAQRRIEPHSARLPDAITIRSTLSRRHRRARAGRPGEVTVYLGLTSARIGIAHLFEFGTGPRRQKKTGRSTGQMRARPYLRPAWEAGKHKVLADFGKLIWIEIERAAKRLARRTAKLAAKGPP